MSECGNCASLQSQLDHVRVKYLALLGDVRTTVAFMHGQQERRTMSPKQERATVLARLEFARDEAAGG